MIYQIAGTRIRETVDIRKSLNIHNNEGRLITEPSSFQKLPNEGKPFTATQPSSAIKQEVDQTLKKNTSDKAVVMMT